jgi:hypothetical protein
MVLTESTLTPSKISSTDLDLGLVGGNGDLEGVLFEGHLVVRLLGQDRADDDVVCALHSA